MNARACRSTTDSGNTGPPTDRAAAEAAEQHEPASPSAPLTSRSALAGPAPEVTERIHAVVDVAVWSPHPIVTAGIHALLAPHSDVVKLVDLPLFSSPPDVVLVDAILLLDHDTAQLRHLRHLIEKTDCHVLIIDRELRPDLGAEATRMGADGFFPMGVDATALLAAVQSATTGWRERDGGENPTVGSSMAQQRARQVGSDLGLTEREVSILRFIAQGYSNHEIAATLFLSINSIKTYIRTAYRRIGVRTRSEAVRWGIQHGLDSDRSKRSSQEGAT